MKVLGVIPARYASTRFPGKALAPILGVPMIARVYDRARQAGVLDELIVATDDARIRDVVREAGGVAVMTAADHHSGTDRVWEAARGTDAEVIVNIQGDEPLIDPRAIALACGPVLEGYAPMATLAVPMTDPARFAAPDQVKVVCDAGGQAVYFSRAPVPHGALSRWGRFLGHIGLYVYRREALERFVAASPGALERCEKLEQLRALELGIAIQVVEIERTGPAVDRPEDIPVVDRWVRGHGS